MIASALVLFVPHVPQSYIQIILFKACMPYQMGYGLSVHYGPNKRLVLLHVWFCKKKVVTWLVICI